MEQAPLFATKDGQVPTKAKMVATIEAFVTKGGDPLVSGPGLRLYGGHSLRVTGAQTLAAAGVDVHKIKILARHSGDSVFRYVAEAPCRRYGRIWGCRL